MYTDAVERTQIYLGDEEIEALDREAERTGASRSELIRRAVRARYGVPSLDKEARLAALKRSAGAWKNFPMTGAEYVDMVRHGSKERRERLGLR